ncbi:hypothetical protein HK100_009603, partial [Physocladia obscura]
RHGVGAPAAARSGVAHVVCGARAPGQRNAGVAGGAVVAARRNHPVGAAVRAAFLCGNGGARGAARYPLLRVHRPADSGAATKLLGALELERDGDTVIVAVDDDIVYHRHTVRALVDGLAANGGVGPTCFVCQYWPAWWPGVLKQRWRGRCNGFLNAYAAVAYRVAFFPDRSAWDFHAPGVPSAQCRLHDDVWLSGILYNQGIRPYVVRPGFDSVVASLPHTKLSINSVKNTERDYRDPCIKFFNYFR